MSRFWSEITKNIEPYVPGEQPALGGKCIKLNTNENPFPPSPKVIDAVCNAAGNSLRLYPDPDCKEIKVACSKVMGVDMNQVFVGNGSDEVLAIAFQAFFQGKNNILIPEISYSFYPVYCNMYGVGYKTIPLNEDYSIDVDLFKIESNGVVIANPNAPTSLGLGLSDIEEIVKYNPDRLVIVDEAYVDFGGESVVALIAKYDNLLVTQTLSKSRSLAGLRVGFAFGSKELIEGMDKIKNSFNSYTIDYLAQKGCVAALLDGKYYSRTNQEIIDIREDVAKSLRKMDFDVPQSQTNFLFIEHKEKDAGFIFQELRKRNIIVRYFNKPKINNRLRVTIGTREEMNVFLKEIKDICTVNV